MPHTFTVQLELPIIPRELASHIFTMAGVNAELAPLVFMTAPRWWQKRQFDQWPEKRPF